MGRAKLEILAALGERSVLVLALLLGTAQGQPAGYVGDAPCARCHGSISKRYAATAMARSSGLLAGLSIEPLDVRKGGLRYAMTGDGQFRFERGGIAGSTRAQFFIGSGAVGRSFLWQKDGFLFQLPMSWYRGHGWDWPPGYESSETLHLSRPIAPECLNCHGTGIQHRTGTQNGYEWPPVAQGGIGCERCHGPGRAHMASGSADQIVNPSKLTPRLRDSVCAQCHLTGVERVERVGRRAEEFRASDDFDRYFAVFVWDRPAADGLHTTSHYERLESSGCRKGAGEKLWCGSCHDSHEQPPAASAAAYYRERCMTCHNRSAHAQEKEECLACHMPRRGATDATRVSFTDHSIPRDATGKPPSGSRELRAFRGEASPRELGMAWARIANAQRNEEDFGKARGLLNQAYSNGMRDAAALTVLGFLEDRAGNTDRAVEFYEHTRRIGEPQAEALVNLGANYAERKRLKEAVEVWREAARRSPGLESAWVKLATAYLVLGQRDDAREAIRRCLEYHPDSEAIKEIQAALAQ